MELVNNAEKVASPYLKKHPLSLAISRNIRPPQLPQQLPTAAQAEASHLLGVIAIEEGDLHSALSFIQHAVSLAPDHAHMHNNLGEICRQLGLYEPARQCCQKAVELNPDFAAAHFNLGLVYRHLGLADDAIRSFDTAHKLNPGTDVYLQLAGVYATHHQPELAIACLQAVLIQDSSNVLALGELARLHTELNDYASAFDYYKCALRIAPDDSALHKNIAIAYKQTGNFNVARTHYQHAIHGTPPLPECYREYASITPFTCRNQELSAMQALAESASTPRPVRMELCFGLFKAFDELHEYDTAFGYLVIANRLKRSMIDYSATYTRELVARIERSFSKEFFRELTISALGDETPMFIVGMPRSGTTLVEQILSSHPQIHGAGELMDLVNITNKLCSADGVHLFPDHLGLLDVANLRSLGEHYLSRLRRHSATAKHITDKMPSNYLRIGFIKMLFPNAKIIHCKRNPIDNALSIYKRYFTGTINYAYDLGEIADCYQHYHHLMQHWDDVLPGAVHTIQYEHLVNDQEAVSRALLDFCQLPWDDSCLRYHENRRSVATASVAQVRQPIYRSSVDSWQHYEKYLGSLACLKELA